MQIEVYTDGSATTKDLPGGFGWVMVVDGVKHSEGSGYLTKATNNDAELQAAIIGLGHAMKMLAMIPVARIANEGVEVTLCSDSQIVLGWVNGNFRFKQIEKILKFDQLMYLVKNLKVKTRWIEGHAGHEHNERADKLAGDERRHAMGKEPKKKTNKSTEMRRVLQEISRLANCNVGQSDPEFKTDWHIVKDRCDQVLGKS